MRHHWLGKILKIAVFAVVAVFLFGFVVMLLWNWLMPALFGLKTLSYLQAWGLLVLSWILFGGLRGHHWHGGGRWRRRMLERWAQMTPEEREKFREHMRDRWHRHHWHDHGGDKPTAPGDSK